MKSKSIRTKLFWCFGCVIALSIANSIHSFESVRGIREQLTGGMRGSASLLDDARRMTAGIANMRSATRGLTLFSVMHSATPAAKARADFERTGQEMRSTVQHIDVSRLSDEDRAAVGAIGSALDAWISAFHDFAEMCAAGHVEEANESALKTMTPLMDTLQKNAAALAQSAQERQQQTTERAESLIRRTEVLNLVLGALILAVGAGAGLLVERLVKSLHEIVRSVMSGAEQVASVSSQLASSSQALAQNASEQAASLQETSASTQQVNAETQKNSETAKQLTSTMAAAVPVVGRVNASLNAMSDSIKKLNGSSQKIASVVKVIDQIAFQTNILALNAAVEAARCGEAGLGFAVVADEVRNLAQRSAQAARETGALIEDSVSLIHEGSTRLDDLLKASHENFGQANQVAALVQVVAEATERQACGIAEISSALPQLEAATQRVAAGAEETAAGGEELNSGVGRLRQAAKQLYAVVEGSAARMA